MYKKYKSENMLEVQLMSFNYINVDKIEKCKNLNKKLIKKNTQVQLMNRNVNNLILVYNLRPC